MTNFHFAIRALANRLWKQRPVPRNDLFTGLLRRLLETIVRFPLPGQLPGKGLPIGNLTSQWFANLYLDGADHAAKEVFGVRGYLRYMDDILLFGDSWQGLGEQVIHIREWLANERLLAVKQESHVLVPVRVGVPFLGWRVFPGILRLLRARFRRSTQRINLRERQFLAGTIDDKALADSVRAIIAGIRFLRPRCKFAQRSCLLEPLVTPGS